MLPRRLLSTLNKQKLPKVAVFDLDHTIWPFGVDTFCLTPPFHENNKGQVIDMSAKVIEHFPDIPQIFQYLNDNGIKIGVASRTRYPTGALSLLKKLRLEPKIDYFEVYPGQKMKHFQRIADQSNVSYEEMIFFDDEERNIEDITGIGVFSVLVPRDTGVTNTQFKRSLEEFSEKQRKT